MSTVKRLEASENTNFLRPLSDEHLAFGQPSDPVAIPESGAINGNPRYQYTPRQRVAPTSATTTTALLNNIKEMSQSLCIRRRLPKILVWIVGRLGGQSLRNWSWIAIIDGDL